MDDASRAEDRAFSLRRYGDAFAPLGSVARAALSVGELVELHSLPPPRCRGASHHLRDAVPVCDQDADALPEDLAGHDQLVALFAQVVVLGYQGALVNGLSEPLSYSVDQHTPQSCSRFHGFAIPPFAGINKQFRSADLWSMPDINEVNRCLLYLQLEWWESEDLEDRGRGLDPTSRTA